LKFIFYIKIYFLKDFVFRVCAVVVASTFFAITHSNKIL